MKISDIAACIQVTALTGDLTDGREISAVYCCDLLSRVMSNAQKDCVWMTVLTNLNIVAVAQFAGVGCILIPEDIPVPEHTVEKAKEEGITIFSTPMTCYEASWRIHDMIEK